MLGQLICLDRRYQRMNCFNIREVQSLLKRRFFADLVNTADHKAFLSETMLGVRFKINDTSVVSSHFHLYNNFGLSLEHKIREVSSITDDTHTAVPLLSSTSLFFLCSHSFSSSFFPPLGFFPLNFYLFNPVATYFSLILL
jgi:hypothetical protein